MMLLKYNESKYFFDYNDIKKTFM